MTSKQNGRREPARVRLPLWALSVLAVVGTILVVISSVWLFRTVRDMVSASELDDPEFDVPAETFTGQDLSAGGDAAQVLDEEPLPSYSSVDEIEPWSGTERITFLFLGVDQRCDEDGPTHTDSIMLASVDPVTMSAVLFSIPRDLWVEIPGFGVDRINQAYYFGQVYEYPGGGQTLARETIEGLLGIPVDYYVTANFQGFIEGVDLIGGIVMDIPEAIDDPDYPDNCYGYEPFSIGAGTQRLDGTAALKYARTRATLGGDVDRAERQQKVLLAVRDQVLRVNMLPQLVVQAPQLWRTFRQNVNTNLSLEDTLRLTLLMQDIPQENIRTAVLDYNYVYTETTPDGRQVLVPRRDEIRQLRDELFAPPTAPTPVVADLPNLMQEERARVALYNGTAVFGLAGQTQEYLQGLGVDVTEIGNADSAAYTSTQIIDYGSHPETIRYLTQQLGIPPLNFSNGTDPDGDYDVLVILGSDWADKQAEADSQ